MTNPGKTRFADDETLRYQVQLERELAQAKAAISAQEDRRIELSQLLATALNDLGQAKAELAAARNAALSEGIRAGQAERRAEEAEKVLRHISLASQNSMSSKEDCGRIARAYLNAKEGK